MTLLVQDLPTLRVTTALDQSQRTGARLLLVLARVLGPGAFEGRVGHDIPRIVDADEQEQHRSRSDDEHCWGRVTWEQNRRDDEGGVGDERQDRVPQPVGEHRLIFRQTVACQPEHDDDVGHPPEAQKAEQQSSIPERLPGCAEKRGDQQRGAKMHDVGRAEDRNPAPGR